jgi:hypothetical protein
VSINSFIAFYLGELTRKIKKLIRTHYREVSFNIQSNFATLNKTTRSVMIKRWR